MQILCEINPDWVGEQRRTEENKTQNMSLQTSIH